MDLRFFRSEPDAPVEWPLQQPQQPGETSDTAAVVLVALERHNDPDALNHLGHDFYGAYGDGELIDEWAEEQPLEALDRDQLPTPLTWFPAPFSTSEA